MRILRSTCAFFALLTPVILHAAPPRGVAGSFLPSDPTQLIASFSVTSPTTVPGKVLKAGSYTIRVVDHLSDRIVLRIEDPEGKSTTTFLGLPTSKLGSAGSGPVNWTNSPKGSQALKGFSFPGGSSVEFVYPKDEAVAIAKVNTAKVAAIDPASDNLPAHKELSRDDMQMVTLWSLSSTRVGPNDDSKPAIQAEHYKATDAVVADATPVATPAQGTLQSASKRSYISPAQALAPARLAPRAAHPVPAPQQVAALHRPSVVSSLPHTASNLPTVLLLTLMSLFGAATLRVKRAYSER